MSAERFRLSRAGVLNVWQYDDQVFDFADGRLLLRGANGAGKSKTLEMLLPFALDGDKLRMTASGRHHTSLLWLMTDGVDGNRTGYVWVELVRQDGNGRREVLTCGVGIRASSSAKQASTWYFTCPRAVGAELQLEDETGPLTKERCREAVLPDGQLFEQARAYKAHVGRVLFGLDAGQYDELLRLLYWLRQPQIGEDIEPAKLAEQLAHALPEVDDEALRAAGDTFDELAAFGEQIDRRARAARGVASLADTYRGYAQATVRSAGGALVEASRELGRRAERVRGAERTLHDVLAEVDVAEQELAEAERRLTSARAREQELEASPEARSQRELLELERRARETAETAARTQASAEKARQRAEAVDRRLTTDATAVGAELTGAAASAATLVAAARRAGVDEPVPLPAQLADPVLAGPDDVPALGAAVRAQAGAVGRLRAGIGERLAAVQVVDAARVEAEQAAAVRDVEQQRVAEAERRAEAARGRREDAGRTAAAAEQDFVRRLQEWQRDRRAVSVDVGELSAGAVAALPARMRAAAAPALAQVQQEQAAAATARLDAERRLGSLHAERLAIEAEPDPAPPGPALERTSREDLEGAPLWRLVAPRAELSAETAAAVEAALEAAGLLDAWVHRDGSVLAADRLDVVLPVGPSAAGRTLADLLQPEAATSVAEHVVAAVLARVAVVDDAATADGDALDLQGGWRLGPLVGRAAKPVLQYLGATARSQERLRRLADVDARIALAEAERVTAASAETLAGERLSDLEDWLSGLPAGQPVLTAWTVLDERTATAERAEQEAAAAEDAAATARAHAAERRRHLESLAEAHAVPFTAEGLAARREQLRALDADVARHVDALPAVERALTRWAQDAEAASAIRSQAEELRAETDVQRAVAADAAERHETVREAAGAGVQELERRMQATRTEIGECLRLSRAVRPRLDALRERLGQARTEVTAAQERQRDHAPVVLGAVHALAALVDVPGLLSAAVPSVSGPDGGSDEHGGRDEDADAAAFEQARGAALGDVVPAAVVRLARRLAAVDEPGRTADAASVYAALQAALSSDAGDAEPRVVPVGPHLAVLGRDDGGEHPVVVLADRLAIAVARDQVLLTDRERTLFEEHLVGDLGELLRSRRLEADDLVEAMNRLLAGVTTSQGIAVRLSWQLRDDVPDDARRAVTLLGRAVTSLTPTERTELRDALHRLIEASRAEAPEDGYAEHLARALDYRRWSVFRIRYTRPEYDGQWKDLHRRSPLSQGEQKVVCYLPLFAAAAAHFSSLAGAAPHAPRFVLLDDAFPKIDVRTHPLLFGLLVDLDLDFVITSERLWGDHATVPSLAIYEALRDPAQRGVAQYRYTWDGARLQAVGA